jgi:O-antigen/teichoic acid export membrane protein
VYAVYAAAIVSGLVVTPITLHALEDQVFGIWTFIGALTIYLALLDFGLGPSVVRFTAEARGRRAPEETNRLASVALVLYAAIGVLTLAAGAALAWLVPLLIDTPDDLVFETRLAAFLVTLSLTARFPLGLVYNLLGGHQRFDVQNLGNFVATVLYAVLVAIFIPRGGGIVLLGALTLGVTLVRFGLPLLWLRREFPELAIRRSHVTRQGVRELVSVSTSNFLVHVANKVVLSTDVVVVGIVLGAEAATYYGIPAKLFQLAFGLCSVGAQLLFPAFAEQEGAGDAERQRRLLLVGLRGSVAAALLIALPLLLIPDLLIEGWVGDGYGESSAVLVLLAVVVLVHQPVYLLTSYLIARALQQQVARTLIVGVAINVVLSVVLAETVGLWGVALATLVTDLAVLVYVVPVLAAPAAALSAGTFARAALRPLLPALAAAAAVLVLTARALEPDTLLELFPLGVAWLVACGFAIWRFGLDGEERAVLGRTVRGGRPVPEPA